MGFGQQRLIWHVFGQRGFVYSDIALHHTTRVKNTSYQPLLTKTTLKPVKALFYFCSVLHNILLLLQIPCY